MWRLRTTCRTSSSLLLLQQDGYRSILAVRHHQIELPIAVEICGRDGQGAVSHCVGRAGRRYKRPIAISQQDNLQVTCSASLHHSMCLGIIL